MALQCSNGGSRDEPFVSMAELATCPLGRVQGYLFLTPTLLYQAAILDNDANI
jgi:hypothetical protein